MTFVTAARPATPFTFHPDPLTFTFENPVYSRDAAQVRDDWYRSQLRALANAHLRLTITEALDHASRALLESDQEHVPARVTDNLFIAVTRLTNAIQAI